ncbi:MAG: Transcriptional regulator, TetR family protein [Frankiales bacterium]|nr:Transcriptional regulator, TetR family protein [Frankiales bacterium]
MRLRDRQRAELRAEIDRVALRLFAEQGFDAVTTEAIAEEVGISPSTFFRHVQSKEQLLLGVVQRGRAEVVSNFRSRPTDEDVVDSLAESLLARTAQFVHEDGTVELWRRAMASAPASLRRASLLADVERDDLIAMVAERLGIDAHRDLRAGVLVRTTLAAAEYAYEWWLAHGSTESLHALTQRSLELAKESPRGELRAVPAPRKRPRSATS